MRQVSIASAKAHLSEILNRVEAGEELQITRRGRPIARLVPEQMDTIHTSFDFEALNAFVDAQPIFEGNGVVAMRAEDQY